MPIEFLRPIPSVALIPLAVLVYGTGLESKVFLAVFASFWPLFVQTLYGVQDVDPVVTDTARSFGLGRFERIWRIRLPAAVPYIATGVRISSAVALILAVTAELVIGSAGLGRSISVAQSGGAIDVMYALIIATGMLGWLLNILATRGERRVLHWHPVAAGAGGMRRHAGDRAGDHRPDRAARALGRVVGVRRHLLLPAAHGHPEKFQELWLFDRVGSDVLPSLQRLFLGYAIACVVAVGDRDPARALPLLRRATSPIVEFLRAIPPPALLPFAIVVLGVGNSGKVFLIAFVCLWPVLLNTIDGVTGIDPTLRETARSYGVSGRDRLLRIVLPAASPQIFAGMRTSLSLALILMVISEMVASTNGIGFFVLQSQRSFAIPEMWAGILLLGLLGYALNLIFMLVERRVLAWHRGAQGERTGLNEEDDARDLTAGQDVRGGRRRHPRDRLDQLRDRGEGVRLRRRPVGLRQDDAAQVHVRPARAEHGRGRAQGPARDRAAAGDGARLPGVLALAAAVDVGARQRHAAAAPQEARQGRDGAAGRGGGRGRRPDGLHRPLPVGAVRRHAAARGDRPRARLPAARSCSWTSRSPRSTRRRAATSRTSCCRCASSSA